MTIAVLSAIEIDHLSLIIYRRFIRSYLLLASQRLRKKELDPKPDRAVKHWTGNVLTMREADTDDTSNSHFDQQFPKTVLESVF